MSPLDTLVAIEDIKRVKARYWRSMDRRHWDEYQSCFTQDCVFDCRMANIVPELGRMPTPDDAGAVPEQLFHGARHIRTFVENLLRGVRSVHQGHIPEIDILTPDTATAIFPFEDQLDFPEGVSPRHIHGYGHYHEKYRRIDGRWYIAEFTIYRLRVTLTDDEIL
jgi:SnoaL-like domain